METIFTKIINGDIPSYKIAENDSFFAFLDINPLARGHTLVVPKKSIDYVFDMEDQSLGNMIIFAKKIAIAIKKCVPCEKVGVAIVGLEIPHVHIHLVPLNEVQDLNFQKKKLKLSPEQFSEIARIISAEIE